MADSAQVVANGPEPASDASDFAYPLFGTHLSVEFKPNDVAKRVASNVLDLYRKVDYPLVALFTDASHQRQTMYGGLSIVIYLFFPGEQPKRLTYSYGVFCADSTQAEALAMIKGINLVLDIVKTYMQNNEVVNTELFWMRIFAFTDSRGVLGWLQRYDDKGQARLGKKWTVVISEAILGPTILRLKSSTLHPEFQWTKGHDGTEGNELADRAARRASQLMSTVPVSGDMKNPEKLFPLRALEALKDPGTTYSSQDDNLPIETTTNVRETSPIESITPPDSSSSIDTTSGTATPSINDTTATGTVASTTETSVSTDVERSIQKSSVGTPSPDNSSLLPTAVLMSIASAVLDTLSTDQTAENRPMSQPDSLVDETIAIYYPNDAEESHTKTAALKRKRESDKDEKNIRCKVQRLADSAVSS
ncbi:hypothetical protein F5Y18DRAFT_429153 [Xylariaceae sp. FL1019]|nr:hypothetical protein F5Y18DRAFT_429153 [Xylariaceae sp. FL1019]